MVTAGKGGTVVLTEGRPWKCILRFALPLFFGSLLQQMYYTVDDMMVGRLAGEQALSGVGTCAVLTNLLIAFSGGFSAGSSIVSAQYFGDGQYQGIGKGIVSTALSSTFLSMCLLFAYTLQHIPAIGYRSLFICKPMAWVIVASINYIYYFKGRWETASAIEMK